MKIIVNGIEYILEFEDGRIKSAKPFVEEFEEDEDVF